MKIAKGADYDRLLAEFLAKGGDLSLCPFDTDDYKYEDPPYKSFKEYAIDQNSFIDDIEN